MYTDHQTTRISSKTTGVPDDARLHHNPILNRLTYEYVNLKPRERFELPCNWSAANRFASKLSWHIIIQYYKICFNNI